MAGSQCSAGFSVLSSPQLPPPSAARRLSLKPILSSYSVSPPFPSKYTKRKNYLRPKILKTLNPKQSPKETLTDTVLPIETPETVPPNGVFLESPSDVIESSEVFQVSDGLVVAEEHNGIIGKFSPKGLVKYGLYILGVFVFQSIFAVWIMANGKSEKKDANSSINSSSGMSVNDGNLNKGRILLNDRNRYSKGNSFSPSNVIYLDELEMTEKIQEIREMAREARKSEQKGQKNKHDEDEIRSGNLNLNDKIDIEKEIGARLANTEKRLNSQRKGLAGFHMKHLDEFGGEDKEETNNYDGEENDNKNLMFKKKYKFKGEKPPNDVKGFGKSENGDLREGVSGKKRIRGLNGNLNSLPNDAKKSETTKEEPGTDDPHMNIGAVQETNRGGSSTNEVQNSRTSRDSGSQNLNVAEENRETVSESDKHELPDQDGSSIREEVGNRTRIRKVKDKLPGTAKDLWWLKLPYVLRIRMRSNIDHEKSEGFFTLRTSFEAPTSAEISYTVAFEDHSDASNFCYLLESYFEELGDFSTDIVPVSTKDLFQEVKSEGKKVIVVRKRQLELYAGQPLEDVERALLSLA